MNITREEPAFLPVTVTLETQREVDVFYALLNDSRTSRLLGERNLWHVLKKFTSEDGRNVADREVSDMFKVNR